LFTQCIEDIKKDVAKRRLKSEFSSSKSKHQFSSGQLLSDGSSSEQFQTTLDKLSDIAKDRIKLDDFTLSDRINLLDPFVNSKVFIREVHDLLFAKRKPRLANQSASLNVGEALTPLLENSSAYESRPTLETKFRTHMNATVPLNQQSSLLTAGRQPDLRHPHALVVKSGADLTGATRTLHAFGVQPL